ncbi:HAAS domain-containing protein [Rossellomorea arthrocnemi]|jgi:uncharacterized membrane-anchored protein|uniref:HAAS domain-containing protein n=1 Tax=Rossellomorea arthrocnemi TaxID=2769542 RepID=UPI001917C7B3|nr:DUF1129 family protein [Rossellomorea arthrocnemi]
MQLSHKSEEFLGNLRIYLISSGKNENEVDEIVGELEDHLVEAEKHGKSVEEVTGLTPKQYMDQISAEMPMDYRNIFKYIVMVLLGALSFIVLKDALSRDLEYSLFVLIGYPIVIIGFLFCTATVFKYVSSHQVTKRKEWTLFLILGGGPVAMLTGLLFLSQTIVGPTIELEGIGRLFALVLAIVVIISVSYWSKTWIMIVLAVLLNVPEMLIQNSSLTEETKLIMSAISLPVLIGGYFVFLIIKEKHSPPINN